MNDNKYKPLKYLRYPLTPYQLFSPVSTVFLDNLTYEDQLLGLYKQFNQFIEEYNKIIITIQELQALVDTFPDQIKEIQEAITVISGKLVQITKLITNVNDQLSQKIDNEVAYLKELINSGDAQTLISANKYTDKQIANIKISGSVATYGLTAQEYDAMQMNSLYYDTRNITAIEYDLKARIVFYGDISTIFLQFKNSVLINPLETVFDLSNPPVKIGRRYQIEISLGAFSLDGNEPAHLEIVGNNTLGNTLPITVPSGGSATVIGIFNEIPTVVRAMSNQNTITGYNAYIKIKPLGEI